MRRHNFQRLEASWCLLDNVVDAAIQCPRVT